jgi:hypothetical protein
MIAMEKKLKTTIDDLKALQGTVDRGGFGKSKKKLAAEKAAAEAAAAAAAVDESWQTVGGSLEGLAPEAQADINLDFSEPKVTFGTIGVSHIQDWWKSFVLRFGNIVWAIGKESEEGKKLEVLLRTKKPVDVILVEAGWLGANSQIWKEESCKAVVSLEGWRGPPPSKWTILRKKICHDALGDVTNGEFLVHVAHMAEFSGFDWFEGFQEGVPEKLRHVLTCTGSGRKVPVQDGIKWGWTEDEKVIWGNKFEKIDTPTVYFKDAWLSRRLELKELKAVLDVPDGDDCGAVLLLNRLKAMKMPGKVYVAILDEVQRAFQSRRRKRIRVEESESCPSRKPPTLEFAATESERKAAADRQTTTGQQE